MELRWLKRHSIRFTSLLVCLVVALWVQAIGPFGGVVKAEEALIEIQSQVGFGASHVKQGHMTPVTITLRNQGEDMIGELSVQIANPNRSKDFSYVQQVELPKGSTKVVSMLLPGYAYGSKNNTFAFYEKPVEKGQKIALDGATYLEAFAIPEDTLQVGVLARDVDTMNFLSLLGQSGRKLNVIHLKQGDIPREALGLDGLDVLALNDFASDTLTKEQVQAILQWTNRGGTLVLAGGAGYPKTAAPFSEAAPVAYQSTVTIQELPELAKLGEKELTFPQPFTLSKAGLVQGAESVTTDGGIPIYARSTYGSGFVSYVAYDLSLNPLASWNGNTRLWEQILSSAFEKVSSINNQQKYYGNHPFSEIDRALEYFPSIQPPRLPALALVLLIYAIVVGPLLYILLKRLDRREWAWAVIPLLAIVTSIGIFQFGATNRSTMMAQMIETLTLNGSGSGVKQADMAVFLPKGGDLTLKLQGKAAVSPFIQEEAFPSSQLHDQSELLIRYEQEAAIVELQDIPYSSLSKISLEEDKPVQIGKLDYTISTISAQSAKGTVTNNTTKDLTDVGVIVSQTYMKIGPLKIGQSANFDSVNGVSISFAPDVGQAAFPQQMINNAVDTGFQQRSVLNAYFNRKGKLSGGFNPVIVGWSKEQTTLALLPGGSMPVEQLTLLTQDMKINYVAADGKIVIPSAMLVPELIDNHLKVSALNVQNGPFMQIGSGDVTLDYKIPIIPNANYQTMEMTGAAHSEITVEIWHSPKQTWEPLTMKPTMSWEGAELQPFIADGKSIRLKVTTAQNNMMFRIPAISLEGSVKP